MHTEFEGKRKTNILLKCSEWKGGEKKLCVVNVSVMNESACISILNYTDVKEIKNAWKHFI
jgi:hypothetical protein